MKKSILFMLFTIIIAVSLVSLFSCNTMTEDSQKFPYFTDINSESAKDNGSKPGNSNSTDSDTNTDSNTNSSIDIDSDVSNDTDTDIDIDTDSDTPTKPIDIVIVFNTDGGNKLENIITHLGEDYTLPMPSKDGYNFLGWYFDNNKIDISGKWSIEASKIELIAKWEKKSQFNFIIEYDFNGGKKGTGEYPDGYNFDTKKFQISRPIREGNYKFVGWQTPDGEITYYYNVKEGTTGNISLKAIWHEYTYTYQDTKGYQYVLKDDNTLSVVGYVGKISNLTIPSSYNEYTVTEIGPYAFCGYGDKIASLQTSGFIRCDIPESITKISIGAFAGCDDLKVQLYYKSTISVEEWVEKLTIEEQNKHVLDVINGARPAIGWNKYWIPGA